MKRPRAKILTVAAGLALFMGAAAFAQFRHDRAEDLRQKAEALTGGSAKIGRRAFAAYGCGGCHSVRGVPQAAGLVGPPLDGIGSRAILAGRLENKPDNMILWIRSPQAVSPGTAMPDVGVPEQRARDIAAFLYTRS
jgi:cytochrome c2